MCECLAQEHTLFRTGGAVRWKCLTHLVFTCLVYCNLALCKQQREGLVFFGVFFLWKSASRSRKQTDRVSLFACGSWSGLILSLWPDLTRPDLTWTHPCRKLRGCPSSACTHRTPVASWSSSRWRCGSLTRWAAETQKEGPLWSLRRAMETNNKNVHSVTQTRAYGNVLPAHG